MKYLDLLLLTAVTFGFAHAQPNSSPASPQAEDKPSTAVPQLGVPNGRSDRNEPFFKTVRLPLASDLNYGVTPEKPIKTGPRQYNIHILLLNSLRGANGEPIEYERKTSCCFFEDKNLQLGGGMLDVYELRVLGTSQTFKLYINMYHDGPPAIPVGFTQRAAEK